MRGHSEPAGVEGILRGLGTAVKVEPPRIPAQTTTGPLNPSARPRKGECESGVSGGRTPGLTCAQSRSTGAGDAGLSAPSLPFRRAQIDPPRPGEGTAQPHSLHGPWRQPATVQGKEGKGCRQGSCTHRGHPGKPAPAAPTSLGAHQLCRWAAAPLPGPDRESLTRNMFSTPRETRPPAHVPGSPVGRVLSPTLAF